MENIVQKYQSRTRKRRTATIVATSLGLAVLANLFAFSQVGHQLAASVLESGTPQQVVGDVYLAKSNLATDSLVLKAGRAMAQVKELSFAVAVDASLVDLRTVLPAEGIVADVTIITKQAPFVVTIRFKSPTDLTAGRAIATVALTKRRPVATPVNLSSTFFKSDKTYELSNAGIETF